MARRKVLNPDKPIRTAPAIVTLNGDTLMTQWNGIEVGKKFKVRRPTSKTGSEVYYFMPTSIEPTREDSPCAWVRGVRVNGRGNPVAQITHMHIFDGETEREELISAEMIV